MVYEKDNREKRQYQHLSTVERGKIEALRGEGYGVSAIAQKIGRNKGTISRELKRGTVLQRERAKYLSKKPDYPEYRETYKYYADTGQTVYERNRRRSRKPLKFEQCREFIQYADRQMKELKWSPEAVCGRVAFEGKFEKEAMVCAKTLYSYVDQRRLNTRNIDLCLKVRRKPKTEAPKRPNKRILGMSIEERPSDVQSRQEFGHWEADSVIGRASDKAAINTLVERKTRFQIANKLAGKGAAATNAAIKALFRLYPQGVFKSFTADNGSEFAGLSEGLKGIADVYFCHPYSSWEKGTNERHNGLIRRHIKKGRNIDEMDAETIAQAADWNNALPRKILNWRTPAECFIEELARVESQASLR
jgi:IS30 family transposase